MEARWQLCWPNYYNDISREYRTADEVVRSKHPANADESHDVDEGGTVAAWIDTNLSGGRANLRTATISAEVILLFRQHGLYTR